MFDCTTTVMSTLLGAALPVEFKLRTGSQIGLSIPHVHNDDYSIISILGDRHCVVDLLTGGLKILSRELSRCVCASQQQDVRHSPPPW